MRPRQANSRRTTLTVAEREALAVRPFEREARKTIEWLDRPFRETYLARVNGSSTRKAAEDEANRCFRLCRQMMLELNRTYWGFTWELILPWWQNDLAARRGDKPAPRDVFPRHWARVTMTLFLMDILPYRESFNAIPQTRVARLWLGEATAAKIEAAFLATAKDLGYRYLKQVRRQAVGILFTVMALVRKPSLADLTKEDLEHWERQTSRSRRVARAGVTCIQKVLTAMGYLPGVSPRLLARDKQGVQFSWGRTPPKMVETMTRFLNDVATVYRPTTLAGYRVGLRRFGAWLGEHDPDVTCVSQVRRPHIEAYKQALREMKNGDFVTAGEELRMSRFGLPMSNSHRIRMLSVLKSFLERIEVLEYPERPGRPLFARGDVPPYDELVPRLIPDPDWHRIIAAVQALTPEQCAKGLKPFERTKAVMTILLECGLRASELCRLDTSCVIVATDDKTRTESYWLRVPLGKLHNDRIIPISRNVVNTIDAWLGRRGPQPTFLDQRTGLPVDYLFTYQGHPYPTGRLNKYIVRIARLAGASHHCTSHMFRHTLATKWREKGMKLETIGKMLGHRDLRMTLRYVAIMPSTQRQEFEAALAALSEEHRVVAQVRLNLSPEAHLEAQKQWRESVWVDLGIGWCGLTAYLPCESRLTCHGCPNFIPDKERLPLLRQQRDHLIELRGVTDLPQPRRAELEQGIAAIENNLSTTGGFQPAGAENTGSVEGQILGQSSRTLRPATP